MKNNEQLQRDVLDELAWEPSVDAASVGVTAADGVVTLTGHVRSYAEKWAARQAVKGVAGVRGVADELEVKLPSSAKRDDADIAKAALAALKWHVEVPHDRLKVMVTDGWVTLEGSVDWGFQRKAADKVVRYLTGVRGVTNLVTVKKAARAQDVKAKIEAALKRSAEVEAKQIKVETMDGKVTLRGSVHSWTEHDAVERAAWSAPGVTSVEDHLTIQSYLTI